MIPGESLTQERVSELTLYFHATSLKELSVEKKVL